ncbi:hypothetical protein DFH09DRAFT_1435381 [Mycena vulgaris]|nr:hypothetical protein DFH09DRAFT_1435381 [Mycena vulgaris]
MSESDSSSDEITLDLADATTIEDHLEILRQSLKEQVPYTGGVHPIKPEDLVVYYATDGEDNARSIDLGTATRDQLAAMAAACQPARFGAGRMDLSRFAAHLDVVASGLIDAISPGMLDGQTAGGEKVLRAEMYKLNVYGPGSFFKAHKDTPRGEDMIGSLVVIFPTAHKGGALTLSHGGNTWTFDSAAELAAHAPSPVSGIAYVAFYSDVTHAVEPVLEGYRVTLTYNLFLADRNGASAPGLRIAPSPERTFEDVLRALLADPTFLPTGGLLAYGLAHQYPMPAHVQTNVQTNMLKGSDARIRTISQRVGLATHVKMLYNSGENEEYGGHDVLVDHVLNTEDVDEAHMSLETEIEKRGAIICRTEERVEYLKEKGMNKVYADWDSPEAIPVHWVTRITELNRVGSLFMAYGNEPSLGHVYGNAALFVSIPQLGRESVVR